MGTRSSGFCCPPGSREGLWRRSLQGWPRGAPGRPRTESKRRVPGCPCFLPSPSSLTSCPSQAATSQDEAADPRVPSSGFLPSISRKVPSELRGCGHGWAPDSLIEKSSSCPPRPLIARPSPGLGPRKGSRFSPPSLVCCSENPLHSIQVCSGRLWPTSPPSLGAPYSC